ncbi:MAG TPA: TRAP transporter substrate-binding protein DctP, partial [Candidatus Methylomirabilis sp.]|nr:TRAP transporter substrate-binding protein DctP [Candidatus Methylomirabilis sp.]
MRATGRLWRVLGCVLVATFTLMVLGVATNQASAATVIRMGHVGYPGSLLAIVNDEYAKRVNEALKGKYEVKVFHSSQLGSDEEMLKGIKVGVLEMFQPSTIMSTVDPKFGVFEMPYLFKDRNQVKRMAEDPQVKASL